MTAAGTRAMQTGLAPLSGSACGKASKWPGSVFCRNRRKSKARAKILSAARNGKMPLESISSMRTGDRDAAAQALHGGPGILDVTVVGPTIQVGYVGGDSKVAEMVSHLVHRGFGVVGIEQDRNELERIFLEATAHAPGYHTDHNPQGGYGPHGGAS